MLVGIKPVALIQNRAVLHQTQPVQIIDYAGGATGDLPGRVDVFNSE
jgi:hypothetical protein